MSRSRVSVTVSNNDWENPSLEELTELYMEAWDPKPRPLFCDHTPVDTGFKKSWCKKCDIDMWLDSDNVWRSKL